MISRLAREVARFAWSGPDRSKIKMYCRSYQEQSTSYGNLSLGVHERIDDLHVRASGLAPAVAESAADSGCTDTRPGDGRKRAQKAWDMIAEAAAWNHVSDRPDLMEQAEARERDGKPYSVCVYDTPEFRELDAPVTAERHGVAELPAIIGYVHRGYKIIAALPTTEDARDFVVACVATDGRRDQACTWRLGIDGDGRRVFWAGHYLHREDAWTARDSAVKDMIARAG